MPSASGTVHIDRAPAEVFAFLAEPGNNVGWESGLISNEQTTPAPMALGSKGHRVESAMGGDEGDWEITAFEQDAKIAMSFVSRRFAGTGGWDISPEDDGTSLRYWFAARPHSLLMRVTMVPFVPLMRRQVRKDYLKLKALLEAGS